MLTVSQSLDALVQQVHQSLGRLSMSSAQLVRLSRRACDRLAFASARTFALLAVAREEIEQEEDEFIAAFVQGTAPNEDARDRALQARVRHAVSGWARL